MLSDLTRELFEEIERHLPGSTELPRKELHTAVQAALSRLDLVTREEFDAQAAVLARSRARLEALEARLAELESTGEAQLPPHKDTL